MFHLIGTVFTYNAHITLPALSPDSTSQTLLLFAGFSLVFFLTIFGVVRKRFYLKKNPSWHSFWGEGSTGNGVSALGKVIRTFKSDGFSSTTQYSRAQHSRQYSTVQHSIDFISTPKGYFSV